MKVKVNRQLSGGRYHINFEVSDFSPEEIAKMESFGIPAVRLSYFAGPSMVSGFVKITQISPKYDAAFGSEDEAKAYEQGILDRLKEKVQELREKEDKFSSSEEVAL